MTTGIRFAAAMATVVCALHQSSHARVGPVDGAFTYQGVLKQGGAPANGTHFLRFQLWDAPAGGAQVGADVDQPSLALTDGLFTTELDFGTLAFDGSARWLEVQVITNGGSTITPLTPRQALNVTPYALYALGANGPGLTNLNASNLASGTVPNTQLGGTYGNALTLSNASNVIAGTFTGNGAAITNLNATNISSGSLAVERLPSGGAWPLSSTLNLDSNTLAIDAVNNRVGIGTASPAGPLHIAHDVEPNLVLHDTGPATTQTGYLSFRNNALTETGWIGFGNPGSPTFSIVNQRSGGHILLAPFNSSSNVGIGTSAPLYKLHVETSASDPAILGRSVSSVGVRGEGVLAVVGLGSGTGVIGLCTGTGGIGVSASGPSGGFDFFANGSGTDYGASSSVRWKRNIEAIADPLAMLDRMRGVYFDWDQDHGGRHAVGMIAEEVGAVMPEIVNYEANGTDAIGMDYSKMSPLLVEAVKALRAEKDAEIARLNERIDELERLVRESLAVRSR